MQPARKFTKIVRFFRRPRVFDVTLVTVLSVPGLIGMISVIVQGQTQTALGAAHYLLGVQLLLIRRSRPVLTVALVTALDVAGFATQLITINNLQSYIAFYSLGRYTSGRVTWATSLAAYAVYAAAMEIYRPQRGNWLGILLIIVLFVGAGMIERLRAELSARTRQEIADAAVRDERRRIARELHDVVAHHITVINALVGGARATLTPEQQVTRDALESAEQTARQAMAEMRHLLDVLRADGRERPDAATGVGADRLPELVEEARSAGLPTDLTVTGEPVELPAAVDHAVYRIVQEALTNTRKHAEGARAGVLVTYGTEAVEVEVLDDGRSKDGGTPGFGLDGMAERVALCGGRLSTGPRPEGGFRVHARIPLEKT
ncbi:sensor histidine kinase [Nonomuraea maritima]|uniref:sensor histidine kinase n=1 Tax=Nonomuraea maritima TaxID=683260 RepID=UPI0037231042